VSWRRPGAGLVIFVVSFAAYAWAAAPGVEWFDAGELTTAAASLGVSHPPAQPLHAMLGALASFLPVGELAFRINLVSALSAALALAGLHGLLRERLPASPGGGIGAATATLLVALSPLFSTQAVRAEVYAPTLALVVWGSRSALRAVAPRPGRHAAAADVLLAAMCFALAAGAQPLVALACALGPALGLAVVVRARLPRLLPWCLALGALGLAVYLYLPLRIYAARAPLLAWGTPLDAISGRAYAGNFDLGGALVRAPAHLLLLGEGAGLPLLLLGGAGLAFAILTQLRGAATLAAIAPLVIIATASQRVFYPDNPDVHGYLAPALVPLALGLGALIAGGGRALARLTRRGALAETGLAALLALPALGLGLLAPEVHASGGARRGDGPSRLANDLLLAAPAGPSLVIADSDHAIFPALYERLIAGVRPDVALGNGLLASSSWFVRLIKAERPELYVPWIDDGQRGHMADRLIGENLRRGHGVLMQLVPTHGESVPRRAGYLLGEAPRAATATPTPAPAHYDGRDGAAIARFEALGRAHWEAAHGHWRAAVHAAGAEARLDPAVLAALDRVPAMARPLWPLLPELTPRFVSAPWQQELVVRDAAFWAGFDPGPPAAAAPAELRLLASWHRRLAGDAAAADALMVGLPARAVLATCDVFPDQARELLLTAVRTSPGDVRLWKQLGLAHAKRGERQEADAAWARAAVLDPADREITRWRHDLALGK
jgi:hypothetical protein